jgi:hypothetical protein
MYFRKKTSGRRSYLQIVESRRKGEHVRQQLASLALRAAGVALSPTVQPITTG